MKRDAWFGLRALARRISLVSLFSVGWPIGTVSVICTGNERKYLFTGGHLIETVDEMTLILMPGDLKSSRGKDFANAVFLEGLFVGELGYIMDTPTRSFGIV